jgi:homocysteine S-methyltransferase
MQNPILPILEQQKIILLDGGLATELEARGAQLNDDLWSAKILQSNPELIADVHLAYLETGADIITTASYQATFQGFEKMGIKAEKAEQLFLLSVELAVKARDEFWERVKDKTQRPKPLVAASIGPYGAYLADGSEYSGNYGLSTEELITFHEARVALLASTETDLLAFETIPDLQEAEALLKLLEKYPTSLAWMCFSCQDGIHLSGGESFAEAIALLERFPQIVGGGINCTAPEHILSLLKSVQTISTKPLLVYPNSGEKWDAHNNCWLPGQEEVHWTRQVEAWVEAGAQIIGGCCRTSPDDIATLKAQLFQT